jgi:hypothetical protein
LVIALVGKAFALAGFGINIKPVRPKGDANSGIAAFLGAFAVVGVFGTD